MSANRQGHERRFDPSQVDELTGVPQRTLNGWDRTGIVKPTGPRGRSTADRPGRVGRLWLFDDVLAVAVIAEFRRHGVLPRVGSTATALLRKIDLDKLAPATRLVIRDGHAVLAGKGEPLPDGIGVFLDLARLVDELRRGVDALPDRWSHDLPHRALTAGQALAQLGGSASPGEIGRITGHTHGTQARAFGDLNRAGLIHRTRERIAFTEAGWETFADDAPQERLAG